MRESEKLIIAALERGPCTSGQIRRAYDGTIADRTIRVGLRNLRKLQLVKSTDDPVPVHFLVASETMPGNAAPMPPQCRPNAAPMPPGGKGVSAVLSVVKETTKEAAAAASLLRIGVETMPGNAAPMPPHDAAPLYEAIRRLVELVERKDQELAAQRNEIEELGAELDALRGDVSREKPPIVHRDLKPENTIKASPRIAPNDREKLYLEFRRKKELAKNGKPLGEPLVQTILAEVRADASILDRWEQSERDAKQLEQGAAEKKAKKREEEARLRPTTSDSERRDRIRELDAGLLRLDPETRADVGERAETLAREAGVTPNSFKWTNKVRDFAREIFEKECLEGAKA